MRKHYTIFIFLLALLSTVQVSTAEDPEIAVLPAQLTFAPTKVESKTVKTITVSNVSADIEYDKGENFKIKRLTFENFREDFKVITSLVPSPEITFNPKTSTEIAIEFAPKSPGTKNTRVWIVYEKSDEPGDLDSLYIEILARAIAPNFVLLKNGNIAQDVFDFGSLRPGEEKKSEFIVKNGGDAPGQISKAEIRGNTGPSEVFFINSLQPLPKDVPPGAEWKFQITFKGDKPREDTDTLFIATGSKRLRLIVTGTIIPPNEPRFQPKEFVFGEVFVRDTAFDTVVVRNDNLIEMPVSQMIIVNDTKDQLAKVNPVQVNFMIPANGSREIVLSYVPVDTLPLKDVRLHLRAFNKDFAIPVFGKGKLKTGGGDEIQIALNPEELNFNDVFVDSFKILSVQIINKGTKPVELQNNFVITGDGFSLEKTPSGKIEPGDSVEMLIKFAPLVKKDFEERVTFSIGNKNFSISLKGNGIEPQQQKYVTTLSLDDFRVAVGEGILLPVRVANSPELPANVRQRFTIELSFTASVLYYPDAPVGNVEIKNGERIVTINSVFDTGNFNRELLRLSFQTALGDMPVGHIRISGFSWLNAAGQRIPTDVTADTAIITITGTEGRLVNSNQGQLALSVSPNPAIGDISVEFSNYEPGATLKIYNTQGELIRDLSGEISGTGNSFKIICPTADIPEGVYFCRLTSGKNSIVRAIFVQK